MLEVERYIQLERELIQLRHQYSTEPHPPHPVSLAHITKATTTVQFIHHRFCQYNSTKSHSLFSVLKDWEYYDIDVHQRMPTSQTAQICRRPIFGRNSVSALFR